MLSVLSFQAEIINLEKRRGGPSRYSLDTDLVHSATKTATF